ncbi:MAG: hemolysin III family protein [Dehalococcoidia bacterium]
MIEQRPLLRGYSHLAAAFVAAVGSVGLLLLADSPRAYIGGAVFAASLVLMYAVSGAYHTIPWGPRMRRGLMRLDHAMIFVVIAGTYTPFCLLVVEGSWGISLLVVVWAVAAAGIALKVAWPSVPRWLGVGLYIAAGWMALVAGTQLADWFAVLPLALLAGGGVLYTAGGVIYALRRPDPFPRVFGYHEVFHALAIGGSALHYSLVAGYLMRA